MAPSLQFNKYNKLNYYTLDEEDQISFDLRTIRNIIIKQNSPDDSHSVVFEIFNRLNSGGINLKAQEIRTSLFHSNFYDMLYSINLYDNWRNLTPTSVPNINMRDIEILLRGFAMLIDFEEYKPSMTRFLNKFSFKAKALPDKNIAYLETLFKRFIDNLPEHDEKFFHSKTGRFNISVYESIFVATCKDAFKDKNLEIKPITVEQLDKLKNDDEFIEATQSNTASAKNVAFRINKAIEVIN